jgi:hypothetical protein
VCPTFGAVVCGGEEQGWLCVGAQGGGGAHEVHHGVGMGLEGGAALATSPPPDDLDWAVLDVLENLEWVHDG